LTLARLRLRRRWRLNSLEMLRDEGILVRLGAKVLNVQGFFDEQPRGVNCANGFIKFEPGAPPTLVPHDPEHRQRHVLPGAWLPGR
jgi:phage/plasmid-associated DNA primase